MDEIMNELEKLCEQAETRGGESSRVPPAAAMATATSAQGRSTTRASAASSTAAALVAVHRGEVVLMQFREKELPAVRFRGSARFDRQRACERARYQPLGRGCG